MELGKVVHSNSHVEYVCQITQHSESTSTPSPGDYAFGRFAAVGCEGGEIVAAVADTRLLNPDFGNLGPRLSPRKELRVFSPDYLAETATLITLVALGHMSLTGAGAQTIPPIAPQVGAVVRRMTEEEVVAFHRSADGLQLHYIARLMAAQGPLMPDFVRQLVSQVKALIPEERTRLDILETTLEWRARIDVLR